MIYMPAWIVEETEDSYLAALGSEPRRDAEPDRIPKSRVDRCVYHDDIDAGSARFAVLVLTEIPECLLEKLPL